MGEIVEFVRRGTARITPLVLDRVYKSIPLLKLEFAEIDAPNYPHLSEQLEFLSNVIEDFAEGVVEDIPYVTIAAATFALIYAHRQFDLIPDTIPDLGHADDSSVVRAVLIEHERPLSAYAAQHGIDWTMQVTVNP
jgi:uncharacterized membrane protein YkvA (DUF1232 family)